MKAIDKFIQAIENHEFVEAHELLEEDWKNFKKLGQRTEAKALQGLINGATALALYHIKKRPEGYKKVWAVFIKYQPMLKEANLKDKDRFFFAQDLLEKKNKEIVK